MGEVPKELLDTGRRYDAARRGLLRKENDLDALWKTIIAADKMWEVIDKMDQPPF